MKHRIILSEDLLLYEISFRYYYVVEPASFVWLMHFLMALRRVVSGPHLLIPPQIAEHDNDRAIDGLQDRVIMLKRVSSTFLFRGCFHVTC